MGNNNGGSSSGQVMRNVFGIIMILVYLGMSVLFFVGFFDVLYGQWKWMRWVCAGLFGAYGLWRAYRQFKGIDYNPADSGKNDDQ